MPRKSNPEKDVILSSASAAPARTRRSTTAARVKTSAPVAPAPAKLANEPETSARPDIMVTERELSHEQIARLAYALWEARGCQGGNPEEDWRQAEMQLRLTVQV